MSFARKHRLTSGAARFFIWVGLLYVLGTYGTTVKAPGHAGRLP